MMVAVENELDPFVEHRGLLFTVAYEMLGSVADAEDVLQDSWLRWAGGGPRRPRVTAGRTWSGIVSPPGAEPAAVTVKRPPRVVRRYPSSCPSRSRPQPRIVADDVEARRLRVVRDAGRSWRR